MRILDGRALGMWFSDARPRAHATRYVVYHWSGGDGNGVPVDEAGEVYRTLVARGDSIHYIGCSDGTLVQTADLDAHCVHAGSAYNDLSIGIEWVCPGSALNVRPLPGRPLFMSTIHGKRVLWRGFTDAQLTAAAQLAQGLLWKYGLAYISSPVCDTDRLDRSAFPKGVIGHYQVAEDKSDPGPETLVAIHSKMVDSKLFSALGAGVLGAAAVAATRRR